MQEYASFMDAFRLTDMPASDRVLTVLDRHRLLGNIDDGAWVKRWLHFGGHGIRFSCCSGPRVIVPAFGAASW